MCVCPPHIFKLSNVQTSKPSNVQAFNRSNVELIVDPIERVTPNGVLTADGREREREPVPAPPEAPSPASDTTSMPVAAPEVGAGRPTALNVSGKKVVFTIQNLQ